MKKFNIMRYLFAVFLMFSSSHAMDQENRDSQPLVKKLRQVSSTDLSDFDSASELHYQMILTPYGETWWKRFYQQFSGEMTYFHGDSELRKKGMIEAFFGQNRADKHDLRIAIFCRSDASKWYVEDTNNIFNSSHDNSSDIPLHDNPGWLVTERANNELKRIGMAGFDMIFGYDKKQYQRELSSGDFQSVIYPHECAVSLWLAVFPPYQGQGYGHRIIQDMCKTIFENTNVDKIIINCADYNIPSQRLAEKNGFIPLKDTEEGKRKNYFLSRTN